MAKVNYYFAKECDSDKGGFVIEVNDILQIGSVYSTTAPERICLTIISEASSEDDYTHFSIDKKYDSCKLCLVDKPTVMGIITEDDVNLKAQGVMTANEKLLGLSFGVTITNGTDFHELVRFGEIPLPQNYTAGFLDIPQANPVTFQMPWAVNFPDTAVNNTAEIYTSGGNLIAKLPILVDWRYFQSLPQLAAIFGVNATKNWRWYQENGWQLLFGVGLRNEIGMYKDGAPFQVRDYDDNPDVNWDWKFYRVSDNALLTAPISNEPTRVVVTATQPLGATEIVNYSTVTVEGIEKPTRWLISSVYAQNGQANSPLQPLPTETELKFTANTTGVVLEFIFDPSKVDGQDGVKFTARNYQLNGFYTERNVIEFPIVKIPEPPLESEYDSDCCDCLPELKLASSTDTELLKNDITGVAHKNQLAGDTCVFKIYKGSQLLANNGVDYPSGFPNDANVSAFVYNWRYYLINHGQGCYKIEKHYTVAGLQMIEEIGKYELLEYTPENAQGTARVLYQNDFQTLWEDTTINYSGSGFEDSYRFRGMFGNWQPNVMSESNFSVLNENRVASIKSKDTYLLNHFHATECHIKRLHKIVMHATIWRMSDHNPSNTLQEKKIYECVLDPESKEDITYNAGSRITGIEIVLSKRQQNSVSLFSGSIEVPKGATWFFPTIGGGGGSCPNSPISIDGVYKADLPSGAPLDILIEDQNGSPITPISSSISGGVATVEVNIPSDTKTWTLQFLAGNADITVVANIGNVATFASGSGAGIGTLTVSTDGVNYSAISYPFTPVSGTTYYFKRSTTASFAEYKMIE